MPRPNQKSGSSKPRQPPATTPAAREQQLIAMAVDLAERQLADGTASVAVITHYLKMGTVRESLEREKLIQENEVLKARVEGMHVAKNVESLYAEAIEAMQRYQGVDDEPELL